MLQLISAFLAFVDFKVLFPEFAPEDADEVKRLWRAGDVTGLACLLADIAGDTKAPLPGAEGVLQPDGLVTVAAMLDHGQERVARFYDQMIAEAAQALGVERHPDDVRREGVFLFGGKPRSWADLLVYMRRLTATPRVQLCGGSTARDSKICTSCERTWTAHESLAGVGCANEVEVPEDGA